MEEICQYNYIEQFALLQDTRNDLRNKPWAKPLYREVFKLRHRIERAREEILRCNVETRRLHTSIRDQAILFRSVLTQSDGSPIYGAVREFITRRIRINYALLNRIAEIQGLEGFTGELTPGVRIGAEEHAMVEVDDIIGRGLEGRASGEEEGEEEEAEGDIEHDDELQQEIGGIDNFLVASSLQS